MMDYACPVWRSAARTHVRKLQVLQSKCLRIATSAPWYMSNRQIHEDLGAPFFAEHIRALTDSFDSKLSDAGNPLVRQIGRYLTEGWPKSPKAQAKGDNGQQTGRGRP
jgi:4-amino-4-deoxy-L-arabinose transferase-like glycosyltransferase